MLSVKGEVILAVIIFLIGMIIGMIGSYGHGFTAGGEHWYKENAIYMK